MAFHTLRYADAYDYKPTDRQDESHWNDLYCFHEVATYRAPSIPIENNFSCNYLVLEIGEFYIETRNN